MATFTFNSNTTLIGTSNADLLEGTDNAGNDNDVVYGLQGDDTIESIHVVPFSLNNSTLYGGQGDDVIAGQNSNVIYGNQGNDALFIYGAALYGVYANNNTVFGGQGDDTIFLEGPGNGNVAYGGSGFNKIFADDQFKSTLDGGQNSSISAEFSTALTIYGTDPGLGNAGISGNDTIELFHVTASTAYGGQGNDSIFSNDGTGNTYYGGGANDTINVLDTNAEVLYGNQGNDAIFAEENAFALTAYGGQGNDEVEQVYSGSRGVLYGNKGNDLVIDEFGPGFANGASGTGAAEGNSVLYGGQGDDTLLAFLAGGDTMFGGQGHNLFVGNDGLISSEFTANDLITVGDFVSGNDSLSMSHSSSGHANAIFVKENDEFANNAGDALSFADNFYLNPSLPDATYLFIYGGSGAGYLFYSGDDSRGAPNDGMILVGDNTESSLSANDIVASLRAD